MARTQVLDNRRLLIGYIEDCGGGKQKAYDRNALLLGYYEPATNSTLDKNRLLFGRGNLLAALIERAR